MEEVKDQRAEAMRYLEKKKILKLFDLLGAKLVKNKPERPNEFLISELEKILEAKTMNEPVDYSVEQFVSVYFLKKSN